MGPMSINKGVEPFKRQPSKSMWHDRKLVKFIEQQWKGQ